jgi:CheY-like chemotaxis protein
MFAKPRVLVVDDDHTIAITLAMILNTTGFEAVATFSGPQALELARGSRFDMLVTDVMMAPLNGIQTAIAFRDIYPASHVFLFTGTAEAAELMLDASQAGYDFRLFSKPIHPAQIIDALQAAAAISEPAQPERSDTSQPDKQP